MSCYALYQAANNADAAIGLQVVQVVPVVLAQKQSGHTKCPQCNLYHSTRLAI